MSQQIDYQQLAQALLAQQGGGGVRRKAVSSTPTSTYAHGQGGLFSAAGLSRPLFSAMVLPIQGLQSRLPVRYSNETNPLHGIITGVTATTGSNPTGVCDDPPTAGLMKLCTHTFVFGRYSRQSRVFDIDRVGKVTNRGEFSDFQLMGNPFSGDTNIANAPTIPGFGGGNNPARTEVAKALFELAVSWSRDFANQIYEGNPANNTSGGGYAEFYGLNSLINTGYRDAITGIACAAADSIISSFANQNVATAAATAVRQITYVYRNLNNLAARANLSPVRWVLAMPYALFYELTDVWPCAYLSYRCTNLATGSTNFIDAGDQTEMRDRMRGNLEERTGQYLLIDGQEVPVVLDDAIDEDGVGSGTFVSQIYFVPMTVLGGTPVTYMEYFNYDGPNGPMEMAKYMAPEGSYYTTDGGRFLWHKKPPTNFCVQVAAKTEPRLILETPYLAARLTNIRYTPLLKERSPFTDSSYFVNGGRTDYAGYGPSYYTPTA
jgi:hypothetical protein